MSNANAVSSTGGLCLPVRQPWAWLIIHGGKDVENGNWTTRVRGRVLIHAAKGMTLGEYNDAWWWATEKCGVTLPSEMPQCSSLSARVSFRHIDSYDESDEEFVDYIYQPPCEESSAHAQRPRSVK